MEYNHLIYIASILSVLLFALTFKITKLPNKVKKMAQLGRFSISIMANFSLNDEEKEKQLKRAALSLFVYVFSIAFCSFLSLAIPTAILWLAASFKLFAFDDAINFLLSLPFILATSLIALISYIIFSKNNKTAIGITNYSPSERLLHDIAFATSDIMVGLSKLEDKIFSKKLKKEVKPPIFISGLPRSGTTLILELCYRSDMFVTHTYRQMPFVHIPMLWKKFASRFSTNEEARERAHGDGMMIDLDSPEAFEEMLWINFWPFKYQKNTIKPWNTKHNEKFASFFELHRQKLIALSSKNVNGKDKQYISKNNLNLARIPWLLKNVAGCKILLPFRDPFQHCGSLLKQHSLFLDVHSQDEFAKNYMRAVGHYDFGENLKPINFNNWANDFKIEQASNISFWLQYWLATYEYLLSLQSKRIQFFDFDSFCEHPRQSLQELACFFEIEDVNVLLNEAKTVRKARAHKNTLDSLDNELLRKVESVYSQLRKKALNKAIESHSVSLTS